MRNYASPTSLYISESLSTTSCFFQYRLWAEDLCTSSKSGDPCEERRADLDVRKALGLIGDLLRGIDSLGGEVVFDLGGVLAMVLVRVGAQIVPNDQ